MSRSPSVIAEPLPREPAPAFDQVEALARLHGDQAFLKTLASMYVEDAPADMAEIRTAIELQDARGIERAAHKLKGSSYPFCAAAVIEVAQAVESIGQSGQLAGAGATFQRLEIEVGQLLTALAALLWRADEQNGANPYMIAGSEGANKCTA